MGARSRGSPRSTRTNIRVDARGFAASSAAASRNTTRWQDAADGRDRECARESPQPVRGPIARTALARMRSAADAVGMMRPVSAAFCCCSLALVAQTPPSPSSMLQVDGALHGVAVRGDAHFDGAGASVQGWLPAGAWRLTFAAGGGVRPAPLALSVPEPAFVSVAVAGRGGSGDADTELAATATATATFDYGDGRALRVRAQLQQATDGGVAGVVARWRDDGNHYRFVRDPKRGELRLERRLGGSEYVLLRTPLAAVDGDWHELELEVDGFLLQAFCDGEPVARALDGGMTQGRCGVFAEPGTTVAFAAVRAAPPAAATASNAVVTAAGRAELTAAVPAAPGSTYCLVLRLDRPTSVWPIDAGLELPLLVRLAEPVFAVGFGHGRLGDDGRVHGDLRWPDAPALRLQTALVGGWIGSPDGSELRTRLPWATLRF